MYRIGLLCMILLPMKINAQQTETLEEIVINESRISIPFNKYVRNIQVITKEKIQRLPVRSLNEVLSLMNGVDLRQRGPFGTQADVSIDGGSFEQTLILVNGIKLSDPQTAHHSLNLPIPLDAIERIEVLRGPAARVYGINALTGAINIVTKNPQENTLTLNLYTGSNFQKMENASKGIYAGVGSQITAGISQNKFNHLIAVSYEKSNGHRYNSAIDHPQFFYQGGYKWNPKNSIQVMGGYTYNSFGANGFYASPIDIEADEIVETSFLSVSSKHQLTDKIKITARISDRYNEDDYRFYRYDLSKSRSKHYNNVFAGELNGSIETSAGIIGVGVESRYESINSSNIGSHNRNNQGIFAEFKTENIQHFILNVGTYINYNSMFGWQIFPGLDMAYILNDKMKISANIGSSQRIPSYTDLYLNQGSANVGNPLLQSENAFSYELRWNYQYKNTSWQIAAFRRSINDFIDWIRSSSAEPYSPMNLGEFKMYGISANFSQTWKFNHQQQFKYLFSYQYLSPNELEFPTGFNSKYQIESLKHQFIASLQWYQQNWGVTLNNRYNKREINKGYFITDLRLNYKLKQSELYASVNNLWNEKYIEAAAVPMPGRLITVGYKFVF